MVSVMDLGSHKGIAKYRELLLHALHSSVHVQIGTKLGKKIENVTVHAMI